VSTTDRPVHRPLGWRRDQARSSHRRGVPTTLPPPALPATDQLALWDDGRASAGRTVEVLPGAVVAEGWLDLAEQRALADDFRTWALPPAGLRRPRMPSGHLMTLQSVCLGWHWQPYRYSATADDTDGSPVKPFPAGLVEQSRRAVAAAYGERHPSVAAFAPDAAIVNLYAPGARLGLHQDGDEPVDAPVVTISLGDTCLFRFAGVDRRTAPFTDLELRSGDLVVFGGPTRLVYHGVPKTYPGTSPPGLGLPPGRVSITVRQTGLTHP
jgi:alkylated DNA repair protein (DNA oxidative demethylase)